MTRIMPINFYELEHNEDNKAVLMGDNGVEQLDCSWDEVLDNLRTNGKLVHLKP